jgi:hypothetical protein
MSVVQLQEEIIEIPKDHEKYNERVAVLCIAYHNLGVELEFLKRVNFIYSMIKQLSPIKKQWLMQLKVWESLIHSLKIFKMYLIKLCHMLSIYLDIIIECNLKEKYRIFKN